MRRDNEGSTTTVADMGAKTYRPASGLSLRMFALALVVSGVAHAALFIPEWWQQSAPQIARQSFTLAISHSQEAVQNRPANVSAKPSPEPEDFEPRVSASDGTTEEIVPIDSAPSQPRPLLNAKESRKLFSMQLAEVDTPEKTDESENSSYKVAQAKETLADNPLVNTGARDSSEPVQPDPEQSVSEPLVQSTDVALPPAYELGSRNNPDPRYPRLAQRRGWQGEVLLGVEVDIDGRTRDIEILVSSGFKVLDEAALTTVRDEWQFEPARQNQSPVLGYTRVPVRFVIR